MVVQSPGFSKVCCLVLALCFLFSLSPPASAAAQAEATSSAALEFPSVRLLPDSPFYFLKSLWENVRLVLTLDRENKASFYLGLADKRLAEALGVLGKGKFLLSEKLLLRYGEAVAKASRGIGKLREEGEDVDALLFELEASTARQRFILERIEGEAALEAGKVVRRAKALGEQGEGRIEDILSLKGLVPQATGSARLRKAPGIFDWWGRESKPILNPLASPSYETKVR